MISWYQVALPVVPTNTYSFTFTSVIAGSGWSFTFLFINNNWVCYATPPGGLAVREARVDNKNLNWSGFPDFGCFFNLSVIPTGLNDIGTVSMYIVDWRY